VPSTASPWTLWYPSSTQRPRQGTEDLLLLANGMDAHMTRWRADDDRLRARPAAKVSWNSTVRYKVNSTAQATIKYNTVELDTGGMTDLQRRNDRIYLPATNRPGLYLVGGSINGLADNLATSVPDVRITSNAVWSKSGGVDYPFTTRDANQDRHETTAGEYLQTSTVVLAYQAALGGFSDELWVGMEINESFNYTVWYAELYAFWITDVGSIPQS
jgi:hypothetical protein